MVILTRKKEEEKNCICLTDLFILSLFLTPAHCKKQECTNKKCYFSPTFQAFQVGAKNICIEQGPNAPSGLQRPFRNGKISKGSSKSAKSPPIQGFYVLHSCKIITILKLTTETCRIF